MVLSRPSSHKFWGLVNDPDCFITDLLLNSHRVVPSMFIRQRTSLPIRSSLFSPLAWQISENFFSHFWHSQNYKMLLWVTSVIRKPNKQTLGRKAHSLLHITRTISCGRNLFLFLFYHLWYIRNTNRDFQTFSFKPHGDSRRWILSLSL